MAARYSLAMIVRNCAPVLDRCLDSYGKYPDEIVLVDTALEPDKEGSSEIARVASKYSAKLFRFPWVEDFAAARNFAFSKCSNQFAMWLDSDDTVQWPERLDNNVRKAIDVGANWICSEYLYEWDGEPLKSNCTTRLMRERVVDRLKYRWESPIHECLLTDFKILGASIPPNGGRVIHHQLRQDMEHIKKKLIRNEIVFEKHYTVDNAPTRMLFYWANNDMGLAKFDAAIPKYAKYIQQTGNPQEKCVAMASLSEAYRLKNEFQMARLKATEAIAVDPLLPTSWLQLAEASFMAKDYNVAISSSQRCIELAGNMEREFVSNPKQIEHRPHFILALAYAYAGQWDMARKHGEIAAKAYGNDENFKTVIGKVLEATDYAQFEAAFKLLATDLIRNGEPEKLEILARAAPKRIAISPLVAQLAPKARPKDKPSLAIFCPAAPVVGPWDPSSIATGIGGSEEAVINAARCFVKKGWHVEVYGVPQKAGEFEGSHWYPYQMWTGERDNPLDVVLWWRSLDAPQEFGMNAKRSYLWMHDIPILNQWSAKSADPYDKIMVLSNYHRSLVPFFPDSKFFVTENGLDPELLVPVERLKNDTHRWVWPSDPSRGLANLLRHWPLVRESDPNAELHVFYGWSPMFLYHRDLQLSSGIGDMQSVYEETERLRKQPGVVWHGKVGQQTLAEALSTAGQWCYTTDFPEIHPVRGDSIIETTAGPRRIDSLVGEKDFGVYSCDSNGDLNISKVGGVFLTRKNARMVKLTLRPGVGRNAKKEKVLYCTPDHEIMLRDGTYKPAGELAPGDRVKAFTRQKNAWQKGYPEVGVTDRKPVPEHRFVAEKTQRPLVDGEIVHHINGNTLDNRPWNLEITGQSEHMKSHWDDLTPEQRALRGKEQGQRIRAWQDKIGPSATHAVRRRAAMAHWNRVKNHVVVAVEDGGTADAFCMTVEPDHNFVANGIFVHNCLTALKCQAHGVTPVTTDGFSLKETVRYGAKMPGPMTDPENSKRAVLQAIEFAKNPPNHREEMIQWARSKTWDSVTDSWVKEWGDLSKLSPKKISRRQTLFPV